MGSGFENNEIIMSPCAICGGQLQSGRVSRVYEFDEQLIIIKHVPGRVCQNCGEGYFNGETVDRLQHTVDQLKQLRLEMVVVDYKDAYQADLKQPVVTA